MVNIIFTKNFKTFSSSSSSSSSSTATSWFSAESHNLDEECLMRNATPNLKIFSFAELKNATRNFRPDSVIGEGGFGKVFKGWLDEKTYAPSRIGTGTVIVVKKLNPEGFKGLPEWQSEVTFLGRLSHPNLVKLLGYCSNGTELLLVYEFVQKGSWDNHLFRRESSIQPPPWDIRLKVAIGAARGLDFLHSSEKQVIHRGITASNILLDGSYNPKLSGFGLAKLGPSGGDSHVSTQVMGIYGYAAPEYVATGRLYVKSDVYGFGVVLLEILTGLRAVDRNRPSGQHRLVDWAKPFWANKRKLKHIMDSRLDGQYPSKGALQAVELVRKCVATEPKSRPSMKEVVEILERIEMITEDPEEARTSSRHTGRWYDLY